jgi:hypothetical protein
MWCDWLVVKLDSERQENVIAGYRGSEYVMKRINPNSSEGIHRLLCTLVAYIRGL